MNALFLDKPTLTAAMKVVWQLIEDADGLQFPARQLQLHTDIANILVPFGFDCETTIVWDYLKESTLLKFYCGFYPYKVDISCVEPRAVVASFMNSWRDWLPIEENKKQLQKKFNDLCKDLSLYVALLKRNEI